MTGAPLDDNAPTLPQGVTPAPSPVSLPVAADSTDPNSKNKPLPPHDTLHLPGYEIQGVLGQGGMGVVYRAREVCLNRPVAIKVLRAGPDIDDEERRRFQTEAEAVARLQHPGIVQVFHFGEQGGQPYLVMELVEGGTLARHTAGQPLQGRLAAGLVEQLARAMHHAHQKGVIHRDLKPANVLLASAGAGQGVPDGSARQAHPDLPTPLGEAVPKIGDFGLAKQLDRRHPLTLPNVAVLGTPGYMAPEQAGGLAHEIGPRTDIYGLGTILYECLTGRPPFQGPHLEVLRQVLEEDPEPPSARAPRVHRDLETICLKAMHKLPGRRYQSALDLADDLARYLAGEPIQGRREALVSRLWRRVRRRLPAIGLVTGLLAAVVMAVVLRLAAVREQRRTDLLSRADRAVETCDGSPEGVHEVNALISELETEGLRTQAEQRRRRLARRCMSSLDDALRAGRLAHDDVERLQSAIDALAALAPEAAAQRRQVLDGRLRDWEEAFDLKPP